MAIKHSPREHILRILKESGQYGRAELLKALYDIRYNTGDGDEAVVYTLLEHPDDGVVASALFTLWHSYDVRAEIESTIRKLARGDDRDQMDMPIQTMAITLLSEIARSDSAALAELRAIAEDTTTSDIPRNRAWHLLAEHFGVDWLADYSEEMILRPESKKSEDIREIVRQAIRASANS
jgi:hypothetical protein